ncbi:hypothetical protein [Candidatus Borrarchaeum sp.]|uniref:hypothetical protein n=1 Tax=Candidatus Borrarchaeum sp. TaxID=2846742 RepID=UPI002579C84A|nr:hypothetical protein [Candidatus Borrarchaeum sp.]
MYTLWQNKMNRTMILGLIIAGICIGVTFWIWGDPGRFRLISDIRTEPLSIGEDFTYRISLITFVRVLLLIFFYVGFVLALATYREGAGDLPGWYEVLLPAVFTAIITYFIWDYPRTAPEEIVQWLYAWHLYYVLIGVFLFILYVHYSTYEYEKT